MGTTDLAKYEELVRRSLGLLWLDERRRAARLGPPSPATPTPEALRAGPLGRDLALLARAAAGAERPGRAAVRAATDRVLPRFFPPAAAGRALAARDFWFHDPLGQMLSEAKYRAFEPQDLLSIGLAANTLKVTRPTVYRWMEDGSLDSVCDHLSGRTFLVRQEVEALRAALAAEESAARGEAL